MLYYSIFQAHRLCIFHVGEQLTHEEMQECYQDLLVDSRWQEVDTVLTDLRECLEVDVSFVNDAARMRMENTVFGKRKVIWLTGRSNFLGKMAMARAEGGANTAERYQFQNTRDLVRFLGEDGYGIMECLLDFE